MHADAALSAAGRAFARTPTLTPPREGGSGRRGLPYPVQRGAGDRLRQALMTLGDHHGQVLRHSEKAWASITFAGARHTFTLLFAGAPAVAAGERLIAALPDHEFAIPGHLVADATVSEVDHRVMPAERLMVTCELLLLEDG